MAITTHAFRIALTAAALCAASTTADAKPRRVVILDFDGPRTLADTGRSAVVEVLGEQYDIVAAKRWEKARATAAKHTHGPRAWKKAARTSGVDAVIEGWVQDEGRHKLLTIAVREASTGREFDSVSVRMSRKGLSDERLGELRTSLDEVLDWIEGGTDPVTSSLPTVTPRQMIGPKKHDRDHDDIELEGDEPEFDGDEPRRTRTDDEPESDGEAASSREDREDREASPRRQPSPDIAAAEREEQERNDLAVLFGNNADEWPLPKKAKHVPKRTPRFMIGAGGFYGSRNLEFEADGETQPFNAAGKGLSVNAAVYPVPTKKHDGVLSGVGFSLSIFQSAAGVVGGDTEETVGNYQYSHGGWDAAIHYRHSFGLAAIDGEVGYGKENYVLANDYPLEVPDTKYVFFHAGAHVDLQVTERATIGFGAKYLYVTDNGPMSDEDWYGPGVSSGFALDGNFVVPLPAQLYIKGELKYRRITTVLDGAGLITEEEAVLQGFDSFINGTANVGIQF